MWRQALNTIPRHRAEWILWLDMDMVLENITFALPLEQYDRMGKDIIMWGQPEWIMKGHNARGMCQNLRLLYKVTTRGKSEMQWVCGVTSSDCLLL